MRESRVVTNHTTEKSLADYEGAFAMGASAIRRSAGAPTVSGRSGNESDASGEDRILAGTGECER